MASKDIQDQDENDIPHSSENESGEVLQQMTQILDRFSHRLHAVEERFHSLAQMRAGNLPPARNTAQQGSSNVNVNNSSGGATAPIANPELLIRRQLVLLLHAQKCQQIENETSDMGTNRCSLPSCRPVKNALNHMRTCQAGMNCGVLYCSSSRRIISHWNNCSRSDCSICQPLIQTSELRQQQDAIAALQSQPGQGQAHTSATEQPSQDPSPDDLQRIYTSLGLSFHDGNPHIQDTTGYVSPFLQRVRPKNPTVIKEWHECVQSDTRHCLMKKIVQAILPPAYTTFSLQLVVLDPRLKMLVFYAQKVECDMYEVSNSADEYYRLLATKIYTIQRELEEKRQRRIEQYLLTQSIIDPFGNPSATTSRSPNT